MIRCLKRLPLLTLASSFLVLCACDKDYAEPTPSKLLDATATATATATVEAAPQKPEASAGDEKASAGRVFFVAPKDGATVPAEFDVEFGVTGKAVVPAGAAERDPAHGHHHLIIDGEILKDGDVVPADETHIHYGDGSTKTRVKLEPGRHKLTMQFADGAHRSYGPDWGATIHVLVE